MMHYKKKVLLPVGQAHTNYFLRFLSSALQIHTFLKSIFVPLFLPIRPFTYASTVC